MTAVLFSTDLVAASAAAGAAARVKAPLTTALSLADLQTRLASAPARLVVVDLSTPGLNIHELVPLLRAAAPSARILAFGPHVHEARLAAARTAGCDEVVSRGQFHSRMEQIFAQVAAPATSGENGGVP
jgi:DNA-binding NarL/FixJ family response regulator